MFMILATGLSWLNNYRSCPFVCTSVRPSTQVRRESQRGPGKRSCGASKHFQGDPLRKKFLNLSFQNRTFWRILYFWPTAGPLKRRGAQGS